MRQIPGIKERIQTQSDRVADLLRGAAQQEATPSLFDVGQSMLAASAYGSGGGNPYEAMQQSLDKSRQRIQEHTKTQLGAETDLLGLLKKQKDEGDEESKALFDNIMKLTGNDPEEAGRLAQALHESPEQVDSSNFYSVALPIAAKIGIKNFDLETKRENSRILNEYRASRIGATTKPQTQLQKDISRKIAAQAPEMEKTSTEIRNSLGIVDEIEQLLPKTSTSKGSKVVAALDPFSMLQNTRNIEKLNQLTNQINLSQNSALKGATSDKDIAFLKDAFANAGQSTEANQQAVKLAKFFLGREQQKIDKYNDMLADPVYQENPEKFYRDLNEYVNSLPSLEEAATGAASGEEFIPTGETLTPQTQDLMNEMDGVRGRGKGSTKKSPDDFRHLWGG